MHYNVQFQKIKKEIKIDRYREREREIWNIARHLFSYIFVSESRSQIYDRLIYY